MKCKECGEKVYLLDEVVFINGEFHQLRECSCGTVYDEKGNDVTKEYYKK